MPLVSPPRVPGWSTSADSGKLYTFNAGTGNVAVVTTFGSYRFYNDLDRPLTIVNVRLAVTTAPATTAILADVNLDGVTVFTTQANRPTIAAAAITGIASNMDITTWAIGSVLTLDVDQIGTGTVGAGLTAVVTAIAA